MALDSNALTSLTGESLPHFTPRRTPNSSGVNIFTNICPHQVFSCAIHMCFLPSILVGPLRFLASYRQSCTIVVFDDYPRKYWWPMLVNRALSSRKLAVAGDNQALLSPSPKGLIPCPVFLVICGCFISVLIIVLFVK